MEWVAHSPLHLVADLVEGPSLDTVLPCSDSAVQEMSEYPELGAKESDCWDVVLEPLLQRVADIQFKITLMHSDSDFIHSDASEYLDLQKSLKWAENYLFQAKQARAYVIRFIKAEERRKDAPD